MDELQKISVLVAGCPLSLEVEPDEERFYREARILLNTKVKFYEKKYSNKSRAQVLTMAAYDLAICCLRYCNEIDGSQLTQELCSINEQIDEVL
jgi:hypothetical protein